MRRGVHRASGTDALCAQPKASREPPNRAPMTIRTRSGPVVGEPGWWGRDTKCVARSSGTLVGEPLSFHRQARTRSGQVGEKLSGGEARAPDCEAGGQVGLRWAQPRALAPCLDRDEGVGWQAVRAACPPAQRSRRDGRRPVGAPPSTRSVRWSRTRSAEREVPVRPGDLHEVKSTQHWLDAQSWPKARGIEQRGAVGTPTSPTLERVPGGARTPTQPDLSG